MILRKFHIHTKTIRHWFISRVQTFLLKLNKFLKASLLVFKIFRMHEWHKDKHFFIISIIIIYIYFTQNGLSHLQSNKVIGKGFRFSSETVSRKLVTEDDDGQSPISFGLPVLKLTITNCLNYVFKFSIN